MLFRFARPFSTGPRSFWKKASQFSPTMTTEVQNFLNRPVTELFSVDEGKLDEEIDPGRVEGTDLMIVKYPHPSLREVNSEVSEEEIASGSIQKLAKEMFLVMYAANGVGLAAPQVGVNKRVMVYNPSGDKTKWMEETVFVNPKVTTTSEARSVEEEGCLSFPGMQGKVERPKWIKVEGVSLKGKKLKKKFTGFEARVFQHEYDHLDGVCYIDRLVDDNERDSVSPVLEELASGFEGEGAKVGFREGLGVTGLDASEGAATAEADAK
ncbi:hypothetical protein TrCOL_g593 [Triparma columacea]|uniref:Peptide deformylase n=1 Tax=Triparma columacea TaxID=722753 RepID=A0A9W7GGP2_9STRA|nr:hypothetical protein TrCOL_g593 [Triparma columacea]